jgi:hypothetical protein
MIEAEHGPALESGLNLRPRKIFHHPLKVFDPIPKLPG